jgi:hypothetical protein
LKNIDDVLRTEAANSVPSVQRDDPAPSRASAPLDQFAPSISAAMLIGHAITSILAPSVAHRLADLLAVVPLDRVSTYLFWLTQKPINPSTSRTAPATIIQSRYSIAESMAQLGRASFLKPGRHTRIRSPRTLRVKLLAEDIPDLRSVLAHEWLYCHPNQTRPAPTGTMPAP